MEDLGEGEKAEEMAADTSVAESSEDAPEMIVPAVDSALQAELESMGFSSARSVRALHSTGSTSLEAAVNWIVEHENDPDVDSMPMVPREEKAHSMLTPEEAKKKAEELREKARKHKEEDEKRREREREMERLRIGKEMQMARDKAEDEERRRRLEERRREKEEEKRARQRILEKLEEDKRERRRRLGLPEDAPHTDADSSSASDQKHPDSTASTLSRHVFVKPASKAEKMRDVLRQLKQQHKDDGPRVTRAFETMLKYISNLRQNPEQDKFRRIRVNNAAFQERVACYPESFELLGLCGFKKEPPQGGSGDEFLAVPAGKVDVPLLTAAVAELNSAITNPYFGVL